MGRMRRLNRFRADLAYSEASSRGDPRWEAAYRAAWPTLQRAELVAAPMDGWLRLQRAGVDRVLHLGRRGLVERRVFVDEKVRRKDYGDILLEVWSDRARRRPGWLANPRSESDWIAYLFEPSGRLYLLPMGALKRAWHRRCGQWRDRYGWVKARNEGYTTWSVPVPIGILLDEIRDVLLVRWGG